MAGRDIVPKGEWLLSIREKRRRQWRRAALGVTLMMVLWFAATGLFLGCWYLLFHQIALGPGIAVFYALMNLVFLPLAKYVPVFPMKGKDAEEIAAEEFLNGPPR